MTGPHPMTPAFREAFRRHPAGVAVITAHPGDQAGGDNRVVADLGQRRAADRRVLAFEQVQFFRTLAEG